MRCAVYYNVDLHLIPLVNLNQHPSFISSSWRAGFEGLDELGRYASDSIPDVPLSNSPLRAKDSPTNITIMVLKDGQAGILVWFG